jgi:hypothetical protein
MGEQRTFASIAWSQKGKGTRRERFLAEMDAVVPWARLPRSTSENRPIVDGSKPANGDGSDVVIALTALPPPPARCGAASASSAVRI